MMFVHRCNCKLCAIYFVTQAALLRQKKAKVCRTINVESWLHNGDVQLDEDEQLSLEGRLEGGLELDVVDLEPDHTAAAQQVATSGRNLFSYLFENLFEECKK